MTYEQAKQLRNLEDKEYYAMYWVDNKKIFVKTKDKNCMLHWAHAIKDNHYNVVIESR